MRINPVIAFVDRTAHPGSLPAAAIKWPLEEPPLRIPPVERVWRADVLCWRLPWLVGPEPYWHALWRQDAWAPPVYPLPYWAVLEHTRLQREEAERFETPDHMLEPARRQARTPRLMLEEAPAPNETPPPAPIPAPRIGELLPVKPGVAGSIASRGYAADRARPATGRLVDVLG